MNLSEESCENKENINMRNINIRQETIHHTLVTDNEGSESVRGTIEKEVPELYGINDPLDYRQDWSKEMIDTFEKLRSFFHWLMTDQF